MNFKKTMLVRGPALTQSGYGEHTRFVLRAMRRREDEFDIHILPTVWGETGWLAIPDEERSWIDDCVKKAVKHLEAKLPYDVSVQVTIPNEWQRLAAINIGVTAGIETNKVSPGWIQQANQVDRVVVVSDHAKRGFEAKYQGQDQNGNLVNLECSKPINVVGYPVKSFDAEELDLNLDYDFNYLAVAQWGPRKNMHNLIKWFVEENHDQEVGLIVKTSLKNNSAVDREYCEKMVSSAIPKIDDCKCKVYLLHGDLSEAQMHSVYQHPQVKVMVSLTHGEGFGLPLFEAAYSGMPVIAPGWSGQTDFLYIPSASKSKSRKKKAMFSEVDYTIGPVPDHSLWEGVIDKGMMWCFPEEGSFKLRMRQVRNNYEKSVKRAKTLQKWILEEYESDKMHEKLSTTICPPPSKEAKEWLSQLSDIEII